MIIVLLVSYFFGDSVPTPILVLIIATIWLFWYWRRSVKQKRQKGLKEIPGPRGLPFIGNFHQLGKNPNAQFCKWSEQYGDIYKVKLASNTGIVISNPKLAKEIFSGDPAFTGRVQIPGFQMYEDKTGLGLFSSEGELWETHRRFLLRHLRDFGFGKSGMESLIMDELQEVLDEFKKSEGKPVSNIRDTLRLAVFNSLWTILTSQRFQHSDEKLRRMTKNTTESITEIMEKGGLVFFFPWLRHLIPERSGYSFLRKVFDEARFMFEETIQQHKANLQEDNLRDFVDVYLAEVKKTSDPNSVFHESIAEHQLAASLFDMFVAGNDTTAVSISWAVVFLCKFPEVQKRLQDEIEEISGNIRNVGIADRNKMPYTLAFLDETMRYSSIVPDGVPHRALADREFHGYFIPKDAVIQPNYYFIHHNPETWDSPSEFRPERFLSKDGTTHLKNENLQPFQIGRRQCVGETFARDTLFLYVTNFFQKYSMKFEPGSAEPSLTETNPGFLRCPKPYSVIMTDRLK